MQPGSEIGPGAQSLPFDPELGRSPLIELPAPSVVDGTTLDRASDVAMAITFSGLDGSAGGVICEIGGSVIGLYIGFRADGSFVARAGAGGTLPDNGAAAVVAPPGTVAGNGILFVEVNMASTARVSALWNGVRVGVDESVNELPTWAGSDIGHYMMVPSSGTVPQGEVSSQVVAHGSVSALRIYQ